MGERKGTNKYYPPDYDPKKGGLNKFMGTHALRERARKLHLGIMIIRFEMPYNIWCEGCNNHIGMGVRYNAEKSKVGMYYSTPIYQFRMKCHLCDNHFEMKTDPGNLDYVIISGARRQERRWDPTENGQVVPDDKQVIHKLADDAMFKLQHGVEDHKKLKDVTPTLAKLENLQERWKDDYMANRALRDVFRTRKRELQDQHNKDTEFLKKRSLDIPLLQESEDDAKVASLIRLQPAKSVAERQNEKRSEIDKKSKFPFPLLTNPSSTSTSSSSNDTSENSVNSDPSASKSKGFLYPQDQVEQRRLSFGIKLKREVPPAATSTVPSAGQVNEHLNSGNKMESSSLHEGQESSDTHNDYHSESAACEINKKETVDLLSESNNDKNGVSASVFDSETCPKPETSKLGILSSLVSYSDDSENSSSVSDSETNETS